MSNKLYYQQSWLSNTVLMNVQNRGSKLFTRKNQITNMKTSCTQYIRDTICQSNDKIWNYRDFYYYIIISGIAKGEDVCCR